MSETTETLLLVGVGVIVAVPVLLGLREMARGFAEARAELRRPRPDRDEPPGPAG
jgi:hypothetical protein